MAETGEAYEVGAIDLLSTYLPMDRRQALTAGYSLPNHATGGVLFSDISGFTPLTEALVTSLGPYRGAEELAQILNTVYDALIAQVHRLGGSVIAFSGDGLTCWFADPHPSYPAALSQREPGALRAVACALAMQGAMRPFAAVSTPSGAVIALALKVGLAAGSVRRFLVGDPGHQRLDVLAGAPLDWVARTEQAAHQGEVVVAPSMMRVLGAQLALTEERGELGVVEHLLVEAAAAPWPAVPAGTLDPAQLRPYVIAPVYERIMAGQGEFLAELRPAVPLFVSFSGIDYDGDDAAGELLDAYVSWAQHVLARYGGYLLQLSTGDKGTYLYGALGLPAHHEDDAVRAVAAGLELRQPPPHLDRITHVQIGISQGRVRAGASGSRTRRTYAALGDEVNVAARLMQSAPPGEVLVSPRIYRSSSTQWSFVELPAVQLKGKAAALQVYQPRERTGGRNRRAVGPLVGRLPEMALLARQLHESLQGHLRILLLVGEAGVGKTRLLQELAGQTPAPTRWLQGVASSIEQYTPYRAWRELLAALLALDDTADQETRRHQARAQVAAAAPSLVERVPLLNDILQLNLPETDLTRGMDPQLRQGSLTALVCDLLRAAAQAAPLVLVLEDAHWLDALSWQLALSVARALAGQPVLLILALRPMGEMRAAELDALAGLAGAATLPLGTMPPEETVTLAAARMGIPPQSLPPQVAGLIRERAGGNPFFAEELACTLRDRGALVITAGTCTLATDLAALAESIPDTVEGVVLSRIDRLPLEQQLTLKVAAVIGRVFFFHTLHDVHPHQVLADLLRAHLEDLAAHDLTPREAPEPELSYVFKHIITQQVAYDTLLFAQRRELHQAVARWYEQVYGANLAPYYSLLAYHWNRAEQLAHERGYARLAGEQAAAQYANDDAVRYLTRALALTPQEDPAGRYALLLAREGVYNLQGQREPQQADLQQLEQLARALGHPRCQAEVALRRAFYAEVISDYPSAIAAAQEAIRWAQADDLQATGHLRWGAALFQQGDCQAAWTQLERALSLAQAAGDPARQADILLNCGQVAMHQGQYPAARQHYGQALDIYRALGNRRGEAVVYRNLGVIALREGDHGEAKGYFEQTLRVNRQVGDRRGEGMSLGNLGVACAQQGYLAEAQDYFEQTLRIKIEVGDRWGEGMSLNNLGAVSSDQGDLAAAQVYYDRALRLWRDIGNPEGEGMILNNLGNIFFRLGDYQQTRSHYEKALTLYRETGSRLNESLTLDNLSRVLLYQGDPHGAQECARQALQIAREIGSQSQEGYVLTNLGYILAEMGQWDQAGQHFQQAVDLRRQTDQPNLEIESLAGVAHAALAQGDTAHAQRCTEQVLAHLQTGSLDGTNEALRIYLTCYRVLAAVQDRRAPDLLQTAHRLLQEQAGRIADPEERRTFLERIAVHQAILTAWRAMPGPAGAAG